MGKETLKVTGYLIWSFEHGAWWRYGALGYTENIKEAGIYVREEAEKICKAHWFPFTGKFPPEVQEAMVPFTEVELPDF